MHKLIQGKKKRDIISRKKKGRGVLLNEISGCSEKIEGKLYWHRLLQSTCVRGANLDQKGAGTSISEFVCLVLVVFFLLLSLGLFCLLVWGFCWLVWGFFVLVFFCLKRCMLKTNQYM